MRRRSHSLLYYVILNVIVSALTTVAVLLIWDNLRARDLPELVGGASLSALPTETNLPPVPTPTLPPEDQAVIQITSIVGAGDINHEVVLLRRVGEGDLHMAGWQLKDEQGAVYTFSVSPELILFKDGGVQVFTKVGMDTATEVYWNREAAVWQSGETITLLDYAGNIRATYTVP